MLFAPIKRMRSIPKKNMNYNQAKRKFPKLNPFGDSDRDGVMNMFDCRPFNRRRQDEEVVTNRNTLKAMEREGNIKMHEHTGKKVEWQGRKVTARYIDEGKNRFEHKGKKYKTKFYSGSFNPYVVSSEE